MSTLNPSVKAGSDEPNEAESRARFAREVEGLAAAQAELDAGFYVDIHEVRAWVDSLRTQIPLPPPATRRR